MARQYHHGDLPTALRDAAVELIAEVGPGSFSLREVARRAGVSHAAPAHHFGDAEGLLTSVATEGFTTLANAMSEAAASANGSHDRLTRIGHAYVDTALANPGHYSVMIGDDYINKENDELLVASGSAYGELLDTLFAARDEFNPGIEDPQIDAIATITWSAVHGLVELTPVLSHVAEVSETTTTPTEDLLTKLTDMVLLLIKHPSGVSTAESPA